MGDDVTTSDIAQICVIAAVCAIGVGLIALGVAWMTRGWSIRWQFAVVATGAVLGTYAGALAIARRMFLSAHDLTVMTLVTTIAAVVAILVSVLAGAAITHWSEAIRVQMRSLVSGSPAGTSASGPAELRALSDELAQAHRQLDEARGRERLLEESRLELISWVSTTSGLLSPASARCRRPSRTAWCRTRTAISIGSATRSNG